MLIVVENWCCDVAPQNRQIALETRKDEFHFKYSQRNEIQDDKGDICLILHSFKIHGFLPMGLPINQKHHVFPLKQGKRLKGNTFVSQSRLCNKTHCSFHDYDINTKTCNSSRCKTGEYVKAFSMLN